MTSSWTSLSTQEQVRSLAGAIGDLQDLSLARSLYQRPDVLASLTADQKYALFSELQAEYANVLAAFASWPALQYELMKQYPA